MARKSRFLSFGLALLGLVGCSKGPVEISGIYPSLAMFNEEGECGTGAVVPWADRLWVVTYGPHRPYGSSDKLYEITPDLRQIIRPESVGGTVADRMVHQESKQLIIGPYLIDQKGGVRTVPLQKIPGRLTGVARHLTDPAGKVYFATMEEGLYEVDVQSLEVDPLIRDGNPAPLPSGVKDYSQVLSSKLPGYHGKGLYSGQGRLVYSNNGERSKEAELNAAIPSGALAEWKGIGDWQLVRRNQFTEVTGPGGIHGNAHPESDPIWSMGWDHRSLILMCLSEGQWHSYRLPKASHCYDGAHGWNTEWPRIREIGEPDLLMTMHGMFWRFPKNFSAQNTYGIRPRSTYLKVIGDFCRWRDRLVFGCDDTAKSEFLNKRAAKGDLGGPGQSQSNLWFTYGETPDQLGPVLGRGGVWVDDLVQAGQWSDPFLIAGFAKRSLFISHGSLTSIRFDLEIDPDGQGNWQLLRQIVVPAKGGVWSELGSEVVGEWIRIRPDRDSLTTTAFFHMSAEDKRALENGREFSGLGLLNDSFSFGGYLRARGEGRKTLIIQATLLEEKSSSLGEVYELDENLHLVPATDPHALEEVKAVQNIPTGMVDSDAASAIYRDGKGFRWRLPKTDSGYDELSSRGEMRIVREVCTERDLMNFHGTFYELPAENAGGIAKVRPIATHGLRIQDFCSYRGLLVMTGIQGGAGNPHIFRSNDGRANVWAGVVDDLWRLGKPRGKGGPWLHSPIKRMEPSDPYLMTGYDRKRLELSNEGGLSAKFTLEADVTGEGKWMPVKEFILKPGEGGRHDFPDWFQAYWVRLISNQDTTATAQLIYD
ncbi:MAG: hypothetical protein EBS59_05685 [Verrucomicrobia bacterium]|nr:hypothetical protein [Verrucomicrobiota bacterium]